MRIPRQVIFTLYFTALLVYTIASARGGGGGTGGGSGGSSSGVGDGSIEGNILAVVVFVSFGILVWYLRKRQIGKADKVVSDASIHDPVWNKEAIIGHAREIFFRFQQDWSTFNVASIRTYCTSEFANKIELELAVLKSQRRVNVVKDVTIFSLICLEATDTFENTGDQYMVEISAKMNDLLIEEATGQELLVDNKPFTEHWTFTRVNDAWILEGIRQATESVNLVELQVKDFAQKNGLYFDPDFGRLMLPTRGVLFGNSRFRKSDVNNHVVGKFDQNLIELYTYVPNTRRHFLQRNFMVAQTILAVSCDNILVKRKNRFLNFAPSGLRRIQTESNDFNRKFCLYATPTDHISSFVLLAPDFMESVYQLPFVLNIEIVGNFLYLYTEARGEGQYKTMLGILTHACRSLR